MSQSSVRGSLVRRILATCFALLLLPLLFHTLYMFVHDYRIVEGGVAFSLETTISAEQRFIKEKIEAETDVLALVAKIPQDRRRYGQLAKELNLKQLTAVTVNRSGKARITASSDPRLVGLPFNFSLNDQKTQLFMGIHPDTQEKHIYVAHRLTRSNYLVGATTALDWLLPTAYVDGERSAITLAFLDSDGRPFISRDDVSVNQANVQPLPEERVSRAFIRSLKNDRKAHHFSIPVKGANFTLVVTIKTTVLKAISWVDILVRLAGQLVIITLFGALIAWALASRMGRPFVHLASVMQRIGRGETAERYKEDRFGFEINELGADLNRMTDQLIDSQKHAKELEIGRDMQLAILPQTLPMPEGFKICASFLAAREVGGDFYDALELEDGRVMIAIADGADKGVSACMYALSARALIRALIQSEKNVARALEEVNRLLCKDTDATSMFVTAWVGILDPQSGKIEYVSCGHLPPMIVGKEVRELQPGGIALGVAPDVKMKREEVELDAGEILLLFTDGVTEAMNPEGKLFGKERLIKLLKEGGAVVKRTFDAVVSYSGEGERSDDITLLSLERV